MIGSFVAKTGGSFADKVGGAKGEYKLHQDDEEEEEDGDDGDELLYYGNKSELVCDGCVRPILNKKQKKPSQKYISCGECKYFLHRACFELPLELPSHPFHECDHILTLQSCHKLDYEYCHICGFQTNGLFYCCRKCIFKADVKCLSLPNTIKHESHPQHRLRLLTKAITADERYYLRSCIACGESTYYAVCYICDICEIMLHSSCCLLPAAVTDPTRDKHPLPLTFDAKSVNKR